MKLRIFLSTIVAYGLFVFGAKVLLKHTSLVNSMPSKDKEEFLDKERHLKGSKLSKSSLIAVDQEKSLSSMILADSILSIIQTYYVDLSRVDNYKIIDLTLHSLQASGYLNFENTGDEFKVEVGDQVKKLLITKDISYESMLETMIEIGILIDGLSTHGNQVGDEGKAEEGYGGMGIKLVLNSLLLGLDAHSSLLDRDSYRELRQGTEGTFGGLGVLVGIRDKILTVIKPLPESPAARNDIRKNDKIISIGGLDTFGYSLDQLVEHMRGDPGTKVDLTLLRPGANSPKKMTLYREVIKVNSVTRHVHKQSSGDVLRLQIESFSSRTSREVLTEISRFRNQHDGSIAGLILDLRSNPGGLLDQSVQVADLFLDSGTIVTTKGRRQEAEVAGRGIDELDFPIIILANRDSASASEIVAGALQDHKRALVVGQPSFGKGSVQTVFELPGERALKLTIARYYTPSGRSIQNVGIIPDVWLQPIYLNEKNINLLGSDRYKNERFLANRLDSEIVDFGKVPLSKRPVYLGYHLANYQSSMDQIPDDDDRDLEIALTVIGKVNEIYGSVLPKDAARSSHWLALASDEVKKKIDRWDEEAARYLNKKFKINWKDSKQIIEHKFLSFSVPKKIEQEVFPGETIKVPFKIVNTDSIAIQQISIFLRSDKFGIDVNELLLGEIKANSELSGDIDLKIPTYFNPGQVVVELGLAVGSKLTRVPMKHLIVKVSKRPTPVLLPIVELLGEVGGKIAGALEANEKAKIVVTLKNDSDIIANDLNVQILNFSGKQVNLDVFNKDIAKILPKESARVEFDVNAAKSLHSVSLDFGLSVEGDSLELPLREKVNIKSIPTPVSKVSNVIAH
ncbi:MAG: S41 family peptidase [Bdellovibrionota bacterium]